MMPAAQYQTGNQIDYAASLKKDCSWGLFRRIEIDNKDAPEAKIPITLYYDPLTGARIKEGELTGDWRRTYADAVEALKYPGGFYHGVAFLLTHNDPYHLTVVKGGGWAMEDKNYSDEGWAMNHMQTQEGTEEILEGQNTYAFHAPFGSDIYLIGKAKRSGNLRKKKMGWMPNYESYDGGWDTTQRKFTPKFVPFSEKALGGYDVPIADVQAWVEDNVFEKGSHHRNEDLQGSIFDDLDALTTAGPKGLLDELDELFGGSDGSPAFNASDELHLPPKKVARIKPVPVPPENIMPVVADMRCGKWGYENAQLVDHEEALPGLRQEWKYDRSARSPKTGEKILWGKETFEETKHLWGSYNEAYRAYESDGESQGVMLLIEPYRTFWIDGREYYVVFFDFDGCRDADTAEIRPRVEGWMVELGTYFEVSPSGKGVRGIGLAEKRPGSRSRFEIGGQQVEVYGGNQGGRHLITITGVPIADRPICVVQGWIDEHVPVNQVDPDNEGTRPEPLDASDDEVMRIMLRSKDAPLIQKFMEGDEGLWEGEASRYKSPSEADQGFFRLLAFYTRKDQDRMERIAHSSKLRRRKWSYGGYLHKSMCKAIDYCEDVYDPLACPSSEERERKKEELTAGCAEVGVNLKIHRVRKNFEACVAMANTFGWYSEKGYRWVGEDADLYIPEEGILFYDSLRHHALYTGEKDASNVCKQMKELRESGLVDRIYEGSGFRNSLYLLPRRVIDDVEHEYGSSGNTNTPISVFDFYVVNRENHSPLQQLVWTQKSTEDRPGLRDNHKLLVELVLVGGTKSLDELIETFGTSRKNFKGRVLKPPIELGLLEYEDEGQNRVRLPENFEEVLHGVYVASGGEQALRMTEGHFAKEKGRYRRKFQGAYPTDHLRSPDEAAPKSLWGWDW